MTARHCSSLRAPEAAGKLLAAPASSRCSLGLRRWSIAGVATVVAALAFAAVAAGYASFRAPGRTIYCELGEVRPVALVCWRARDGRSIGMLPTGRALVNPDTNTRNLHHGRAPVLAYGRTWRGGQYRCTSRAAGVTCRNRSGHGWFLGRSRGYRLF